MSSSPVFVVWHGRLDHLWRHLENAGAILAGIAFLVAMLLVSTNAVMRHVFDRPLTFQFTLTESYLIVIGMLAALSQGYRTGGVVQVALLTSSMPKKFVDGLTRILLLISAVYMAALAYEGWARFYIAYSHGETELGVIDWPVDWSWVWVPFGCGILAVRLLIDATAPELREIGKREDEVS